jgi:hypothetical protein
MIALQTIDDCLMDIKRIEAASKAVRMNDLLLKPTFTQLYCYFIMKDDIPTVWSYLDND